MAEHCALSAAMIEVLPLRDTVQAIGKGLRIDESCLTTFHVTIWEDNMGTLTLANLDPGQSTPRSKFYDSKDIGTYPVSMPDIGQIMTASTDRRQI